MLRAIGLVAAALGLGNGAAADGATTEAHFLRKELTVCARQDDVA